MKERAEPYTKFVEELPQMRREAAHLVRQAVSEGRNFGLSQRTLHPMC